jgi:hypothetical protein
LFCAALTFFCVSHFPGLTCLLCNDISIWSTCCGIPATRPCCIRVDVCVCVRTTYGGQLDRLDWKLGTRFWVFGQRSGPRADGPASCASKKMQQDHHRFMNYTGPRCEVTLPHRSLTSIYRFIGLSLRGQTRDLIRCQDNSAHFATGRHWTSRQSKCRWCGRGTG